MKRIVSITLLVLLGLQFNAPALLWVGYSTFAHDYFVSRCENPTTETCQGHCQVEKAEKKATQSEHETLPSITIAKLQPAALSEIDLPVFIPYIKQYVSLRAPSLLIGVHAIPLHPPRLA